MRLEPEDELVVVSDGLLDLFGTTGEALDALAATARTGASAEEVVNQVAGLAGDRILDDDLTCVAVRRMSS